MRPTVAARLASPLPFPPAITISDADKGGTGKSMATQVMAHCCTIARIPWVGIDGDPRNPHLYRFYGPEPQVERKPLITFDDWDKMMDMIERVPSSHAVIIDCPAGAGHLMDKRGLLLKELAAHLGRPFIRLFALDEQDDVLLALNRTRHLGFDHVIACLNGRFGPSADAFELWREPTRNGAGPSFREQVLKAGGLEVFIPALRATVLTKLRQANLPFHRGEELNLTWSEHRSLTDWCDHVTQAFAPVIARATGGAR